MLLCMLLLCTNYTLHLLCCRDCQDRLQHSIKVERQDRGAAELGPRMSLVFKQRLKDELGRYVED